MSKKKINGLYSDANTVHIGDAIQDLLKSYRLKSKFDEANLVSSWERLVGKPVARRTKKVFIRNHVLFVELDSPGMKHDLNLHKNDIVAVFAKEFGPDVIKEIVIM
jgi:predicted nucleic acid-binding Zn ribbon protein